MKLKKLTHFARFCLSSRTSEIIAVEVLIGILCCLSSLCLFILITHKMLEADFTQIDLNFSRFVYSLRTPFLNSFMIFISSFGENILLLFAYVFTIMLLIRKHRREAFLFCLALLMGLMLNLLFKNMVQRPRPSISPLILESDYSFPSGHAMNSLIFYGLVSYFSYHFFRNKKLSIVLGVGAGALILLIGFSRIYLGVHYLSDVVAGYIAGFWWFVTVLLVQHTLLFYELFRESKSDTARRSPKAK